MDAAILIFCLLFFIASIILVIYVQSTHCEKEDLLRGSYFKIISEEKSDGCTSYFVNAQNLPTTSNDMWGNKYSYDLESLSSLQQGDFVHKGDCIVSFKIIRHKKYTTSSRAFTNDSVLKRIDVIAPNDGYVWHLKDISPMGMSHFKLCDIYDNVFSLVDTHYTKTYSLVPDDKLNTLFKWNYDSSISLYGLEIELTAKRNRPILKFLTDPLLLYVTFYFENKESLVIYPEGRKYWLSKPEFELLASNEVCKVVCLTFNEKEVSYEKKDGNLLGYYALRKMFSCIEESSSKVEFRWNTRERTRDYESHKKFCDLIVNEAEEFIRLRDGIQNNLPLFSAFQKRYPDISDDIGGGLNYCIGIDIYRCYIKMGEPMDMDSICEQGLAVLITAMVSEEFKPTYSSIGRLKQMKKQVRDFLVKLESHSLELAGNDLFVMAPVFKECDPELYRKYMDLLYEWSYTVAAYDKYMSDTEKNFLERLKNGAEPETDEEKQTKVIATDLDVGDVCSELNGLIGLDSVKNEVSSLVNFIKIQKSREEQGLKTSQLSYHCVFTGNPGTGKTTVARILADIYRKLGILKTGQLIETDRSGLVAEYVGQTAVKTNAVIDKALDGVLFIDEAYSLAEGGANDYGNEAITTLLKRMEDDRKRLVVILAGYNENMRTFISSNPGLQSRFNRYICFPDYSAEELQQIFLSMTKANEYALAPFAAAKLKKVIDDELNKRDPFFGNGRYVRNLFEKTIQKQADRLSLNRNSSKKELMVIKEEDITSI